jgi:hypothetical protein
MKKYKVIWEVSKHAIVKANNENEAIEKVCEENVKEIEDEIVTSHEAFEIKDN